MNYEAEEKGSMLGFLYRIQEDHVGAYAAQAAYFLILSFFPLVLFITTLIRYTPLTYSVTMQAVNNVIPNGLQDFVTNIIREIYFRNTTLVPLTAITTLWSAGKGIQAITNGLNCIYHVRETRNWLVVRIYSIFYTVAFVVALVGCLLILIFGMTFQRPLSEYAPILGKLLARILSSKSLWLLGILLTVFTFFYKYLPNRKTTFRAQLPGAFLTTAVWLIFSYGVSLYFKILIQTSNIYGSLTSIIVLLLWLYGCMFIFLIGAEINAYFEKDIREAKKLATEFIEKERHDFQQK